jgi:hypothetical protein
MTITTHDLAMRVSLACSADHNPINKLYELKSYPSEAVADDRDDHAAEPGDQLDWLHLAVYAGMAYTAMRVDDP